MCTPSASCSIAVAQLIQQGRRVPWAAATTTCPRLRGWRLAQPEQCAPWGYRVCELNSRGERAPPPKPGSASPRFLMGLGTRKRHGSSLQPCFPRAGNDSNSKGGSFGRRRSSLRVRCLPRSLTTAGVHTPSRATARRKLRRSEGYAAPVPPSRSVCSITTWPVRSSNVESRLCPTAVVAKVEWCGEADQPVVPAAMPSAETVGGPARVFNET